MVSKRTIEEASDKAKLQRLEKALHHSASVYDKIVTICHDQMQRANDLGYQPSRTTERVKQIAEQEEKRLRELVGNIDKNEVIEGQSTLGDHFCEFCGREDCYKTEKEHQTL